MARFNGLSRQYGFDWVDVFKASDIGMERLAVARTLQEVHSWMSPLSDLPMLLEAGCGRGYFTTALSLTHPDSGIFALDRMNGYGRDRWWARARNLWSATGVADSIRGVRGDLARLPFGDGMFDTALSVHGLRNMRIENRPDYISELGRVTRPGGLLMIAEYASRARSRAQRLFLELYSMKTKLSGGDYALPTEEELIQCFDVAGIGSPRISKIDTATREPIWAFDIDSSKASADDRRRYEVLIEEGRDHGVLTPPTLVACGLRM